MKIVRAIVGFLKEVRTELRKVNWPTQKETVRNTVFVLVLSAAVAIIIGSLDFVFIEALRALI